MATLVAQDITRVGLTPVYAAADVAGDQAQYSPIIFLHVVNGDASPVDVTVLSTAQARQGLAPVDLVVTVPNDAVGKFIGPFAAQAYQDSTDGTIKWTYASVVSLTVAVIKFNQST